MKSGLLFAVTGLIAFASCGCLWSIYSIDLPDDAINLSITEKGKLHLMSYSVKIQDHNKHNTSAIFL